MPNRTNVDLGPVEKRHLEDQASTTGLTQSEILRRCWIVTSRVALDLLDQESLPELLASITDDDARRILAQVERLQHHLRELELLVAEQAAAGDTRASRLFHTIPWRAE